MKYPVRRFKSMQVALAELAPFVRNGARLPTGKPFARFGGLCSREILANWLLCATINAADGRSLTFSSDPIGGDGIVEDAAMGETWQTEHVFIPPQAGNESPDAKTLILNAIEQKRSKGGAAYAEGKTLVVFLDAAAGVWYPNAVARALPEPLLFESVWVVGLQKVEDGDYIYGVTLLDTSGGNAPTYLVHITSAFDLWEVTDVQ